MSNLDKVIDYYHLTIPKRSPVEIYNEDRDHWVYLLAHLGYKVGVELGTEKGYFAETIVKANPQLEKLYCVDMWATYPEYRDHLNQGKLSAIHIEALDRLGKHKNIQIIQKWSMEAVNDFADNSLDFVYIDANHELLFVMQDIHYWSKKVRPGGIISGHDFYRTKTLDSRCHVTSAVMGYTHAYWIHPWFIVGSKAMPPGIRRDRKRSWFWVKKE